MVVYMTEGLQDGPETLSSTQRTVVFQQPVITCYLSRLPYCLCPDLDVADDK